MLRIVCACGLALAFSSPAAAQDDQKILLRWFGHSFFQIESPEGAQVVFDPHAIEEYGEHYVTADLALITHEHEDHNQPMVLANRQKAKVIHALKGEGRRAMWQNVDEKLKDVRVRTMPPAAGTYHDRYQGEKRGKNGVFIVEVAGVRFVHLGDLGHTLSERQIQAIGPVDVLMIPVGGIYTINGSEAKEVVAQLQPRRYVVPMHFGTEVYDFLLSPEEFLDGQENVRDLREGNVLVIDPAAGAKKRPEIVRLGWRK